jgi:hypothetical protein
MKAYASNAAYFDELARLATRMEHAGHSEAAAEVRHGASCVNGLTDGWALLMDSMELTIRRYGESLPPDQLADLRNAFEAARKAVYRI